MNNNTTDNFWQVMNTFQWPDAPQISYRLYHDDQGQPLFYTMEDLPGDYIVVDQSTYVQSPQNVKVRDGQLIVIPPRVRVTKLSLSDSEGTACDPTDVCVIADPSAPHQKWKNTTNDID